jgi:hypothetical protein
VIFLQQERKSIFEFRDRGPRKLHAQDFLADRRAVEPLHFADRRRFILTLGEGG